MVPQYKIQYRDPDGGSSGVLRSYGNCEGKYIAQIGTNVAVPTPEDVVEKITLPLIPGTNNRYQTFFHWADSVGRAIMSLSNNIYVDSRVLFDFSVTSEINND